MRTRNAESARITDRVRRVARVRVRHAHPEEFKGIYQETRKRIPDQRSAHRKAEQVLAGRHRDEFAAAMDQVREERGWPRQHGGTKRKVSLVKVSKPFVDEMDVEILYGRGCTAAEIAANQGTTQLEIARLLVPKLLRWGYSFLEMEERLAIDSRLICRVVKEAA